MAKMTVADLEVLFTANTDQVDKADKQIVAIGKKVESNPIELDADAKPALAGMDRVEGAAKKLVSERAVVKLDADITRAEKSLGRAKDRLEDLNIRAEGGIDVSADVKRAEAAIKRFDRQLDGLKRARNVVDIDADTSSAEKSLDDVEGEAGEAGEDSGEAFGKNIIAALVSIPIAGAVIGIGVAAGKALIDGFNDGLAVEKRTDRLQALTGIDEVAALRLGAAAGEAYANNFGESIESNMDATRLALQFRILDPGATTRDAQLVVQGLAGIADVLSEDVRPIAQAVTQLLSTGLAKNAGEAYDLIAAGARNGLDRNEDLVDTLTEYPSLFKRLGLSGAEALGLVNQGMRAGARNSDLAADALKEFQIRATDASKTSAEGYKTLGLNAEDMTARIARGGKEARDGLAEVLTALRETEDPVARNTAAVALFGTQAEDLGDALFAMDLSTAVEQLDGVTGSAQHMFDTIASNDASKIEQAQRNIEVAADGIKGALAGAFADPVGDFADWVSQNRGPLLQFFSDLVNGAIDFAISANEGFGSFVAGPLAAMVDGVATVIDMFNGFDGKPKELTDLVDGMRGFESTTDTVTAGLEDMRSKFNGFADGQIALGYVNDAALRTADALGKVGETTDGSAASTAELEYQVRQVVHAMEDELEKAAAAGESQQNLTDRYNATTQALVDQLVATGMEEQAAWDLIAAYGAVPEVVNTTIEANTAGAQAAVDGFITTNTGREIRVKVAADGTSIQMGSFTVSPQARGSVVEFMAAGGVRGATPMAPIAQTVPPNTWRVVGDRSDVPEAYIPLDGSARSMSILFEAMRRMGVMPMADGAIASPSASSRRGEAVYRFGDILISGTNLTPAELQFAIQAGVRAEMNRTFAKGGL